MQMQNGQHVDTPFLRMEVHPVGKVTEQRTLHLVFQARWTTSRRAIRQINDLATCARCLCEHRSRVGQRWGSHCTPPSARE